MREVAVVTGASSGIGAGTALALARRGVDLVLTYHSNPEGVKQTLEAVRNCGVQAEALQLDIANVGSFGEFRDRLRAVLKDRSFRYLVHNAGVGKAAPYGGVSQELFEELLGVLFRGPYFLTQTLLPDLADGGAIVHVGSSSTQINCVSEGYSAYASMKGAINVLTLYLAKELSSRGIRVNCVAPGPTRTRLGGDAFAKHPEFIQPLADQTALGRIGESEDIGGVIASLLSPEMGWVTGQILEASGGFRL
jgi:NAD(P)-dependent dehydrogenase (short-subunit alcohol dehydrogenase family)